LEVTPNRPDCLSALGIAHEVAALTGASVREPDRTYPEAGEPFDTLARVEVLDPDLCYRYTASLVTGVKIGPSPQWLQERLLKAGQRPINNVVDVTKYVMLEYGQQLHAIDYQKVHDHTIIVRAAHPGEVHTTLDGVERKLAPPMLVIADPKGTVGLAGIMGGANTEMTEATTAVLLESATFSPTNTRRTSQGLKLRTEASLRFEKGLQPELSEIALRRATRLIQELAGGAIARGIIDVYPRRIQRPSLQLTATRLRKVLGADVPGERVEQVLSSLGFRCHAIETGVWEVTVPYWRSDISLEDDLVEEVARVTGYDAIPTTLISTPVPRYQPDPARDLRERVRDMLAAAGLQEIISYSLTDEASLRKVGALEGGLPLRLSNPMTPERQYLRTSLRSSVLEALSSNLRHAEGPVRLFELGRIYLPVARDLPEERETLVAVLAGPDRPTSWRGATRRMDFFDAKGLVSTLLGALHIRPTFKPTADASFHPGRCAQALALGSDRGLAEGIALGLVGEVHPDVLERFDIAARPVAMVELDVASLLKAQPSEAARFVPLPRFPEAQRDISLLVGLDVTSEQVEDAIRSHKLVVWVELFDVYAGEKLAAGVRSLAYHIHFQSAQRTLTAEEVNKAFQEIATALERRFGATLRA
ncbi:MAG: phenylalanine--tRNA ligase subunit beta, partial [Chloroflexota bacterium]|nr:phenylalanine--tRNA ligase subunit beta [Chloroflexota bacterium]